MKNLITEFENALLSINAIQAEKIFNDFHQSKSNSETISLLVIPVLENIGKGWENGKVSLAQVYMSSKLCEQFVDQIMPENTNQTKLTPKCAIVVFEDYHHLGKHIIAAELKACGHPIEDWGQMDLNTLFQKVQQEKLDYLLISTLMMPSAIKVGVFIKKIKELPHQPKIIVGGAPFRLDPHLWNEVGADATAVNANEILKLITSEATR